MGFAGGRFVARTLFFDGLLGDFWCGSIFVEGRKISWSEPGDIPDVEQRRVFRVFVLTMLQIHQGGFWKFCLSYGVVLLALTVGRSVFPTNRWPKMGTLPRDYCS